MDLPSTILSSDIALDDSAYGDISSLIVDGSIPKFARLGISDKVSKLPEDVTIPGRV
jgi:hypothetical protein